MSANHALQVSASWHPPLSFDVNYNENSSRFGCGDLPRSGTPECVNLEVRISAIADGQFNLIVDSVSS